MTAIISLSSARRVMAKMSSLSPGTVIHLVEIGEPAAQSILARGIQSIDGLWAAENALQSDSDDHLAEMVEYIERWVTKTTEMPEGSLDLPDVAISSAASDKWDSICAATAQILDRQS